MAHKSKTALAGSLVVLTCLIFAAACQNPGPGSTETPASSSQTIPIGTTTLPIGTAQSGGLTVRMTGDHFPPVQGNNIFQVAVSDAGGQPVEDAAVSYSINMTNMNMGNYVVTADWNGQGYSAKVFLSMAGPWRINVTVKRGNQTTTVHFDFLV